MGSDKVGNRIMSRRDSTQLLRAVDQLVRSGVPLSFYDALGVVRRARRIDVIAAHDAMDNMDSKILASMITMHDLSRTTDGARAILGHYLRGQARRQAAERELAARVITVDDSGKTARAVAGATLTLELKERRGAGFRWHLEGTGVGVHCERRGTAPGNPPRAQFAIELRRAGLTRVVLQERPPPGALDDDAELRRFELRIVVEADLLS